MLMRVATLVFLFCARIRFPKTESIASIIRGRYGEKLLKEVRKFEKLDYKLRKVQLDLDFLNNSKGNDIIPNFLNFRLANKKLQDSFSYKTCQHNLLLTEINLKRSHLRVLKNEFYLFHNELKSVLSCIDFAHVCSLFLSSNNVILKSHDSIQQKKFNVLLRKQQPKHDPDRVIFNYSKISLSDAEKSLLAKGLRFSLPPKKLNYADYLVNFELFYRSIRNLDVLSNGDLDFVKTKIKYAALSSFRFYNANIPQNLSDEELEALEKLSKDNNLVVQKADKGNFVVLVDKDVYVNYMENILKDQSKFEKVKIKTSILSFQVNHEKRINEYLKSLKNSGSLSVDQYKKIKAVGSRPGLLYGLCKVHKAIVDICPPFRPILSAIGTPTYKIAKFLVPVLNCVTVNEFTIKESFAFAKEIVDQESSLFMASLDVDSLFTNIRLDETINICTESIFNESDTVEGLNKSEFKELLS